MTGFLLGKTVIVGLARDCASNLGDSLDSLSSLATLCASCRTLIVTNDNIDDTAVMAQVWCEEVRHERTLLRLDGLANTVSCRVERLAQARNCALSVVRSWDDDIDFLIMADLDGPISELNIEDVKVAFNGLDGNWSGLFANSYPRYYDIWALRHQDWCPKDCWQEVQHAIAFAKPSSTEEMIKIRNELVEELVFKRQRAIPQSDPRIEVDSAFGGLAIYRFDALANHWYSGRSEGGDVQCEHVHLNKSIRSKGGRLFILPSLVVKAPLEHLRK